jgi:hypothetical protein
VAAAGDDEPAASRRQSHPFRVQVQAAGQRTGQAGRAHEEGRELRGQARGREDIEIGVGFRIRQHNRALQLGQPVSERPRPLADAVEGEPGERPLELGAEKLGDVGDAAPRAGRRQGRELRIRGDRRRADGRPMHGEDAAGHDASLRGEGWTEQCGGDIAGRHHGLRLRSDAPAERGIDLLEEVPRWRCPGHRADPVSSLAAVERARLRIDHAYQTRGKRTRPDGQRHRPTPGKEGP